MANRYLSTCVDDGGCGGGASASSLQAQLSAAAWGLALGCGAGALGPAHPPTHSLQPQPPLHPSSILAHLFLARKATHGAGLQVRDVIHSHARHNRFHRWHTRRAVGQRQAVDVLPQQSNQEDRGWENSCSVSLPHQARPSLPHRRCALDTLRRNRSLSQCGMGATGDGFAYGTAWKAASAFWLLVMALSTSQMTNTNTIGCSSCSRLTPQERDLVGGVGGGGLRVKGQFPCAVSFFPLLELAAGRPKTPPPSSAEKNAR